MSESEINSLLYNTNVALVGEIRPNLRAVQVQCEGKELITWFYFDGEISEEDEEFVSIAVCESSCSYNQDYIMKDNSVRIDYPQKIPDNGRFAFLRYEKSSNQEAIPYFLNRPLEELLNAFGGAEKYTLSDVWWPSRLMLLFQEALLGHIRPNLRALRVAIDESKKVLYVWVYFDGEVSDNDLRIINEAIERIRLYFKKYFTVESQINRIDWPQKIPYLGFSAYLRKEERFSPKNEMEWLLERNIMFLKRQMQDALLGKVGPSLRAVKVNIDDWKKELYFWFYYDGEIPQRDQNNANKVADEITRTCGVDYTAHKYIERLDYPQRIPSIGELVYLRDEKDL